MRATGCRIAAAIAGLAMAGFSAGCVGTANQSGAPRHGLLDALHQASSSSAERCQAEAGDPDAPGDVVSGHPLEEIPATAVDTCRDAVAAAPTDLSSRYHLSRALLAAGDAAGALPHATAAAEGGVCGAMHLLAGSKEVPPDGSPADLEAAIALYERAVRTCNYAPAAEALAALTFDVSIFVRPEIMTALWKGDEAAIVEMNRRRPQTASFLKGVRSVWAEFYLPGVDSCAPTPLNNPGLIDRQLDAAELAGDLPTSIHRAALDALLALIQQLDPVWGGESLDRTRMVLRDQGRADSLRLLSHYGGCSSPAAARIARSIEQVAARPRSVIDIAKEQSSDPHFRDLLKKTFSSLDDHGRAFSALLE